jgi:hypothetical protein
MPTEDENIEEFFTVDFPESVTVQSDPTYKPGRDDDSDETDEFEDMDIFDEDDIGEDAVDPPSENFVYDFSKFLNIILASVNNNEYVFPFAILDDDVMTQFPISGDIAGVAYALSHDDITVFTTELESASLVSIENDNGVMRTSIDKARENIQKLMDRAYDGEIDTLTYSMEWASLSSEIEDRGVIDSHKIYKIVYLSFYTENHLKREVPIYGSLYLLYKLNIDLSAYAGKLVSKGFDAVDISHIKRLFLSMWCVYNDNPNVSFPEIERSLLQKEPRIFTMFLPTLPAKTMADIKNNNPHLVPEELAHELNLVDVLEICPNATGFVLLCLEHGIAATHSVYQYL